MPTSRSVRLLLSMQRCDRAARAAAGKVQFALEGSGLGGTE